MKFNYLLHYQSNVWCFWKKYHQGCIY